MNTSTLKLAAVAAMSALTLICAPAAQADIIIPGDNAGHSGGSNNNFPFDLPVGTSQRYQQFYGASEFGAAPVTLYGMKFRLATGGGTAGTAFSGVIPSISINLSTAATGLNTASLTFANNVGADVVNVFDGALSLSSTAGPVPPFSVQPFDIVINFENPFIYDPTKGDLLVDISNFSGGITSLFDFVSGGSAVMTRVVGAQGGVNDSTAFFQQHAGLVTAFSSSSAAVPEPATWALMIGGFGLVGATLRRSRRGGLAAA